MKKIDPGYCSWSASAGFGDSQAHIYIYLEPLAAALRLKVHLSMS